MTYLKESQLKMINLADGIDLSSHKIEQAVSFSSPQFIHLKDSDIEYAIGFPNMMLTLWGYITTYRLFPSQTQFMYYYLRVHSEAIAALNHEAVKARLLRAYPSLAREIHFYSLAIESGSFKQIYYSTRNDIEYGVDLQASLGDKVYNISCYILTKRSNEFLKVKRSTRHTPQANTIDIGLDLASGKHINGWIFFDRTHVDILQHKLINYAWQHYGQHPLELIC